MAQDLMRFHDRSKFEIHVFATSKPDTDKFLNVGTFHTTVSHILSSELDIFDG
jgi:predicted O-linked N-acetylglucosamine transferase (SPINDLY family)